MIKLIRKWMGIDNIRNRKVAKSRILYLYVIFGSIVGLAYFFAALIIKWPLHWALTPMYLLLLYVASIFIKRNIKIFMLYVADVDQGRLMLFLNEHTHFSDKHKLKLVKWVYLDGRTVRLETRLKVSNKLMEGGTLTKDEKKLMRYKVVNCPQQVRDGFNEAILVNALIYANNHVQVLDDELRTIMNLTLENMLKFDLNKEYEKCQDDKYRKLMESGKKAAERLNKEG